MDGHEVTRENDRQLRVLELYCGIGGCAAALTPKVQVVAAMDINQTALDVYRWNFPHTTLPVGLDFVEASSLRNWHADLWWLSPPCQPFTVRGLHRDSEDPRARSFLRIIECLPAVRPHYLAMENVPGFAGSHTHGLLREALDDLGYSTRELLLCPTELGLPNRRRRFYLVAGLTDLLPETRSPIEPPPLGAYLEPDPSPDLWIDEELVDRYRHALDIVDPESTAAVTACFTSAYGRSPVRSGSYLQTPTGIRRFSPLEIVRLLGFPPDFELPPDLSTQAAWRLVGNSLSVPAVRCVLSAIPELAAVGLS